MINLITTKVELLLLISKQQEEFTTNDKEFKLISNYEELMKVISEVNKRPDENIFKFIYSYKNLIHSFTLYENEECININDFKLKNEFAEFYYLDRLIMDEEEIANYEYDHSFIKKVNEFFKMNDAKNDNEKQQRTGWFASHIRKLFYRRDPEPYNPDGQIVRQLLLFGRRHTSVFRKPA